MRYYSDLEMLDEINILFKYLYMDENHFVYFKNAVDVPFKLWMIEDCFVLRRQRTDKEDAEPQTCDYDLYDYAEVVNQLKEQGSSFEFFENKWEEIRSIVASTKTLHEINTRRI